MLLDFDKNPIAIIITKSSTHDSEINKKLFDNLLINMTYIQKYKQNILFDTAYASFISTKTLTDLRLNVMLDSNKHYIKRENYSICKCK